MHLTPALLDITNDAVEDTEVFGPLLLITWDNFEEALSGVNDTNYGLAAGLLSNRMLSKRHFGNRHEREYAVSTPDRRLVATSIWWYRFIRNHRPAPTTLQTTALGHKADNTNQR